MRYIRTSNGFIELIEEHNEQITSSNGFQFGQLYYRIQKGKVTFYLIDQENPWRNDVWTMNIPITIDGEVYSTESEASAALKAIMIGDLDSKVNELISEMGGVEADIDDMETRIGNLESGEEALGEAIVGLNDQLQEKADAAVTVCDAEYVSSSHTIYFYNVSGDSIASIDAGDFIVDGMVDNVYLSGTNLVIEFNTDSGKEDIEIPIGDVFDPSNYYTKQEIDQIHWFGTEQQYNAIVSKNPDTIYFIYEEK